MHIAHITTNTLRFLQVQRLEVPLNVRSPQGASKRAYSDFCSSNLPLSSGISCELFLVSTTVQYYKQNNSFILTSMLATIPMVIGLLEPEFSGHFWKSFISISSAKMSCVESHFRSQIKPTILAHKNQSIYLYITSS